jgi:hypothetical protein
MDRHAIRITGKLGVIRWGFHEAATVGPWTIQNDAAGVALTAPVTASDPFRLTQAPLSFQAAVGAGTWRWPVESLTILDGTLTARLGFVEDR